MKPLSAKLPVNLRDTDSGGNDWANCTIVERPAIPAEMLTNCVIKITIFIGSKRRLTF